MSPHGHDRHAVRDGPIKGLEVPVIERVLAQSHYERVYDVLIRDLTMDLDPRFGVRDCLSTETENLVGDKHAQSLVADLIESPDLAEHLETMLLEVERLPVETISLGVVQRTHVGLGE